MHPRTQFIRARSLAALPPRPAALASHTEQRQLVSPSQTDQLYHGHLPPTQGNKISVIADNAFAGLSSLTQLGLGGNKIKALKGKPFAGLSSLANLDVTDNNITFIGAGGEGTFLADRRSTTLHIPQCF